jgi:hypothetical protein
VHPPLELPLTVITNMKGEKNHRGGKSPPTWTLSSIPRLASLNVKQRRRRRRRAKRASCSPARTYSKRSHRSIMHDKYYLLDSSSRPIIFACPCCMHAFPS